MDRGVGVELRSTSCHMNMLKLNIDGWSQQMVQWVESLVRVLGAQQAPKQPKDPSAQLPRWPGVAPQPEQLKRSEIYRDAC